MTTIENKYVGFCDILGFSSLVLGQFDATIAVYKEFRVEIEKKGLDNLTISLYSDSILVVGDDLIEVAQAIQILLWTCLRYDWLVRGGIGYGKHWKESNKNNLFIVSEALVKAANIEKTIGLPIIAISDEIDIGINYWMHCIVHRVFDLPIIHYDNRNIINPFNNYWFKSAEIRLANLKSNHPEHKAKYDYMLTMIEDIKAEKEFVPKAIIENLLEKKIISKS